jgi:alcohol dehydrogenase class IV
MATNPGDPLDYLEVIGRNQPLRQAPLPLVTIPTTAGAGAEVTRNAVLASPAHRVKASLRSPRLLPRLAVVDPVLTLGLPAAITAATGLDALTQLIEPFVSCRANPLVDGLCREGLVRAARSLRRVVTHPDDLAARTDMALASLLSGLALANAGLGAVHGFAAPIGGMFPAPHGFVCAALLPHVMAANIEALRARGGGPAALERYAEVARIVTGRADATAADGLAWVRALGAELATPSLGSFGVSPEDVPALCEKAAQASSMKANPVVLQPAELAAILREAIAEKRQGAF